MAKHLTKLSRGAMRSWAIGHLRTKQGGLCAICQKEISLQVMGNKSDYVVDHCHETGEIRGVLHRSCNAAEGKVTNAAGRWGAKSTQYEDIIPFLDQLVQYIKKSRDSGTGLMYPDHKTQEEKAQRARTKRNTAAAIRRAKQKVKEYNE